MSNIKVWIGTDGRWSESFAGLDKVHIIKSALLSRCRSCGDEDALDAAFEGFEIDAHKIEISSLEYSWSEYVISWNQIEKSNHILIASARTLKLPLPAFEEMAAAEKSKGYIFAAYKEMFKAAKVPEPTPEGYCIMLKFEDE